jgi:ADP-heptose:LPS heptosyltransferase
MNLAMLGDMGIGNLLQNIIILKSLKLNIKCKTQIIFSGSDRAEIILAKQFKYVDKIICINKETNYLTSNCIKNLYKINLHVKVIFLKFTKNNLIPLLKIYSPSSLFIGHYSNENPSITKYHLLYNHRVSYDDGINESENANNLIFKYSELLNTNFIIHELNIDDFRMTIRDRFEVFSLYRKINNNKFIIISPFVSAKEKWKMWPINNWITILNYCKSKNIYCIITGSKDDFSKVELLLKPIISKYFINYCGHSYMQLFLLLQKCILSISNDSSLQHFSSIVKNKHISIIGPSDKIRSLPISNNIIYIDEYCVCNTSTVLDKKILNNIIECKKRCINKIGTKQVLEKMVNIFDQ